MVFLFITNETEMYHFQKYILKKPVKTYFKRLKINNYIIVKIIIFVRFNFYILNYNVLYRYKMLFIDI